MVSKSQANQYKVMASSRQVKAGNRNQPRESAVLDEINFKCQGCAREESGSASFEQCNGKGQKSQQAEKSSSERREERGAQAQKASYHRSPARGHHHHHHHHHGTAKGEEEEERKKKIPQLLPLAAFAAAAARNPAASRETLAPSPTPPRALMGRPRRRQ
uniref:Uncharacterized protein n=1 Tax=Oryza nivara TaxID=4536 RepID=A0A0E0FJH5_ORYNI